MRTLGAIGLHISIPEISTCLTVSVDEEVCCAGTISQFSMNRC